MEIQLINEKLLAKLHQEASENERRRQNFDLRNSQADTSQRMLNVLEPGTKVPIHRHSKTAETVICLEGCLDEVIYTEIPNLDAGGPIYDGDHAIVESNFREVSRVRLCPREGKYGAQIPQGAWHSIVVHEPSTIFEAKDGPFEGGNR